MIEYSDESIRPLVLKLLKMSGYVRTFKDENNKLMSLRIDDDMLLEKYEKICSLPVYDKRYIKTKIKTYGDTNFRGLNMQGDGVE